VPPGLGSFQNSQTFYLFLTKMFLILSREGARENRLSMQTEEKRCCTTSTNRIFNFSRNTFFTERKIPSSPSSLVSQQQGLESWGLWTHRATSLGCPPPANGRTGTRHCRGLWEQVHQGEVHLLLIWRSGIIYWLLKGSWFSHSADYLPLEIPLRSS